MDLGQKVIEDHHRVSVALKTPRQVTSNEPGAAGY
jgi:hypothetical protein